MKRFKNHYPVGVVRTCNGSGMTVTQQRRVLSVIGIEQIWRLGVNSLEDVTTPFLRRQGKDNSEPWPTVLVTPFPAVLGKDRRAIFKMLLKHDQALYDLDLGRFINLNEGTADSILYEERCHKQRAANARGSVKNPGRKSKLDNRQWNIVKIWWCDPFTIKKTNDEIADDVHAEFDVKISAAAISAKFGPRTDCIDAELKRRKKIEAISK